MSEECEGLLCDACVDSSFIIPNEGCETAQYSDEQPSLSSPATSWFSSSAIFPSGDYRVEYLLGAMKYGVGENWALNKSVTTGFYVRFNNGSSAIQGPGSDFSTFATQVALEANNNGQFVTFHHSGGRIGVHLVDTDYTTNSGGTQSPLFRLTKICQVVPTPPSCVPEELGTTTPTIFSDTVSWFNDGSDFTAGVYSVSYIAGALKYNSGLGWALNSSSGFCFRVKYNGGDNQIQGPQNSYSTFPNQADLESENYSARVSFYHSGGKIGVYLNDLPYNDNIAGSPSPTFQLNRTCGGAVIPPLPPEFTCGEDSPTVEGMMCAMQERQFVITGSEVTWPDRANAGTEIPSLPLTPTPAYPPEGFFSGDSTDSERVIQVQSISDVLGAWVSSYCTTAEWTGLASIPVYDLTSMAPVVVTEENFDDSLVTLQGYACLMTTIKKTAFQADHTSYQGTGSDADCATAKALSISSFGIFSDSFHAPSYIETASFDDPYYAFVLTAYQNTLHFNLSNFTNTLGQVSAWVTSAASSDGSAHINYLQSAMTLDSLFHQLIGTTISLGGANETFAYPDVAPVGESEVACNTGPAITKGWYVLDNAILQVFKSNNPALGHWDYYP